jgi:hypothetical protein
MEEWKVKAGQLGVPDDEMEDLEKIKDLKKFVLKTSGLCMDFDELMKTNKPFTKHPKLEPLTDLVNTRKLEVSSALVKQILIEKMVEYKRSRKGTKKTKRKAEEEEKELEDKEEEEEEGEENDGMPACPASELVDIPTVDGPTPPLGKLLESILPQAPWTPTRKRLPPKFSPVPIYKKRTPGRKPVFF